MTPLTNQTAINGLTDQKPHFVLIPLLAPGHMIPMVDMARILAGHGATVTFVTTPFNAARIASVIDRTTQSGLPVHFLTLRFPCVEMGLPEGCENLDAIPSRDLLRNFLSACEMLREPLIVHLRQQQPAPSCVIADSGHHWAAEVAREFGITRLAFNGFGSFARLCRHIFHYNKKFFEGITDENEPFILPGVPHRIEITKAQSPDNFTGSDMDDLREKIMDTELMADGVVVNTFDDLELLYVESYQKITGKKVWTIGPMSLSNRNAADMAGRGNKASIDENRCLSWLDSMSPGSVVYVSFGSLACTPPSQLSEIGFGLEASNCPFIWVIKAGDEFSEVEEWLSQGFEERVAERGLIIRGWAPQLIILSHPAVGGFMTHCGWNSTLESMSAGLPMITWPHFAEQFLNEKLIVEILRIGIAMGVKDPVRWAAKDSSEVLVRRDDVEKAVRKLMDGENEGGKEMRERAQLLGVKARKAMEEGGSSYKNMALLVQQIHSTMAKE